MLRHIVLLGCVAATLAYLPGPPPQQSGLPCEMAYMQEGAGFPNTGPDGGKFITVRVNEDIDISSCSQACCDDASKGDPKGCRAAWFYKDHDVEGNPRTVCQLWSCEACTSNTVPYNIEFHSRIAVMVNTDQYKPTTTSKMPYIPMMPMDGLSGHPQQELLPSQQAYPASSSSGFNPSPSSQYTPEASVTNTVHDSDMADLPQPDVSQQDKWVYNPATGQYTYKNPEYEAPIMSDSESGSNYGTAYNPDQGDMSGSQYGQAMAAGYPPLGENDMYPGPMGEGYMEIPGLELKQNESFPMPMYNNGSENAADVNSTDTATAPTSTTTESGSWWNFLPWGSDDSSSEEDDDKDGGYNYGGDDDDIDWNDEDEKEWEKEEEWEEKLEEEEEKEWEELIEEEEATTTGLPQANVDFATGSYKDSQTEDFNVAPSTQEGMWGNNDQWDNYLNNPIATEQNDDWMPEPQIPEEQNDDNYRPETVDQGMPEPHITEEQNEYIYRPETINQADQADWEDDYVNVPLIAIGACAAIVLVLLLFVFLGKRLAGKQDRAQYKPLRESFNGSSTYHEEI